MRYLDQEVKTRADAEGNWMVRLAPMEAGGGGSDLVIEGSNTLTFAEVVVGEVWIGSGQSNMWGPGYPEEDPALARAIVEGPYPDIRLYVSPEDMRGENAPRWGNADAGNMTRFSALLFSFGLTLHRELDVPVGLILGAVNGTPSGAWTPESAILADPVIQESLRNYREGVYARMFADYQNKLAAYESRRAAGETDLKKPVPPPEPGKVGISTDPGSLYHSIIEPMIPYGIRGVLWDQGEAYTGIRDVGQFAMMRVLIQSWREAWGQGDFPFIAMQKPTGGGIAWDPEDELTRHAHGFTPLPRTVPFDHGGKVQEYLSLKRLPETYVVSTGDIAPPYGTGDINTHPRAKYASGTRAAQVAFQFVYDLPIPGYGPMYEDHEVEGDRVSIRFQYAPNGLAWRHGEALQGFALSGGGNEWHWAEARIEGREVIVHSDAVPEPRRVKYGMAADRRWANLFSAEGLPAVPFERKLER